MANKIWAFSLSHDLLCRTAYWSALRDQCDPETLERHSLGRVRAFLCIKPRNHKIIDTLLNYLAKQQRYNLSVFARDKNIQSHGM